MVAAELNGPDNSPETRRKFIGGSDAAAVCGLSRWTTPLEAWLFYMGELPAVTETPAMYWGKQHQPTVLAEFAKRTGKEIIPYEERLFHPDYPWMAATIDSRIISPEESIGELIEAKTAGAHMSDEWGDQGTDEIPQEYCVQASHQMACTGAPRCWVPVLIGGSDFRIYKVERNDELIAIVVDLERQFWESVQRREPPDPDWEHASTAALMSAMYPARQGESVDLETVALDFVAAYEKANQKIDEWEKTKEQAKAKLIQALGGAAWGNLPDGRWIERKEVQRKEYTVKATSYTDFRIKSPKRKRASNVRSDSGIRTADATPASSGSGPGA